MTSIRQRCKISFQLPVAFIVEIILEFNLIQVIFKSIQIEIAEEEDQHIKSSDNILQLLQCF